MMGELTGVEHKKLNVTPFKSTCGLKTANNDCASKKFGFFFLRVRQAIEKKDDIVQTAKAKHRAAEDHIKHLEAMLQHQRRINSQAVP